MALSVSAEEWMLTAGLLISFFGFLISVYFSRKEIARALADAGVKRNHVAAALLILVMFAALEIMTVKPTQLLFFDDVIYQSQGLDLLRTGQAVMCNFGTPYTCFSGQVFHEPIGTALNLAIGYLINGIKLQTTYATDFAVTALAVLMAFFCGSLLFKNPKAALFSEFFMSLSPIILVWAFPTSSDMPALLYAMIAIFSLLVYVKTKNNATLAMLLFSSALLTYMKINAMAMLPVLLFGYLLLTSKKAKNIRALYGNARNLFNANVRTSTYLLYLLFLLLVAVSVIYAYNQFNSDDYGAAGTSVPNSCTNFSGSMTATSAFAIQNFEYNICANIGFWFNQYQNNYHVYQPMLFSFIAILGAVIAWSEKRRAMAFVSLWFLVFFVMYTAFYAGAVTFGIDWRFMLACIAPVCLFAGYGAERTADAFANALSNKSTRIAINTAARFAILFLLLFPLTGLIPALSIQPSQIQQAPDARFYENFVFQNASAIPASCLVFSYDPTLFFMVNRSSAQMFYLYNTSFMQNASAHYSCLVYDRGFWCYTPNNLCTNVNSTYTLTPLLTANFTQQSKTYGFYYLKQK